MQAARAFKLAFEPVTRYDPADRSSLVGAWLAMLAYDGFFAGWGGFGYVSGHLSAFAVGPFEAVSVWLAVAQIGVVIVVATQVVRVSLVRLLGPRRWPLMDRWLWSRIAFLPPFVGIVIGLPAGLWWAVGFDGARWLSLLPRHLIGGGAMMAVVFALALRRPFTLRAQVAKRRERRKRPPPDPKAG